MPGNYAHYRFGTAMLETMPADIARTIKRYRRLYDVGLHGPDPLYYYNPLFSSQVHRLADKYHGQTGGEFFQRVCRMLRLEPSEPGFSYLQGVLCHYCLDAVFHPFVAQNEQSPQPTHIQIETEFDRFLLEKDGKIPPHRQNLSRHLRLSAQETGIAARFYPGISARQMSVALENMNLATQVLAASGVTGGKILRGTMQIIAPSKSSMIMRPEPDPACQHLNEPLYALYGQAVALFGTLQKQLSAHLTYNAPFGPEFSAKFG